MSEHNYIIVISAEQVRGHLVDKVIKVTDIPEKMEVPSSYEDKLERRLIDGIVRLNDQDVFLVDVPNLFSVGQ